MSGITVEVVEDYEELSRVGPAVVARWIAAEPEGRAVIATGETPMGVYRNLAEMTRAGALDASRLTVFQLDEYVGLEHDDRRSLGRWAFESFVRPLGISSERVVPLPLDGGPTLREYDRRIEAEGGYDLAILGIGENGHLGFNEPPCDASAPTREVTLSEASVAANARYWGEASSVPRRAVTVGMTPLLATRTIVLLASGSRKREIVGRALLGPVTPDVPASYLQRAPHVIAVIDRAAWDEPGSDPGSDPGGSP